MDQVWLIILVGLLTFGVGLFVLFIIDSCCVRPRANAKLRRACDSFTAKYSESRGVSISLSTSDRFPEFKITVKQPGVAIPGVSLFVPSKTNADTIHKYQDEAKAGRYGPTSYGTSSDADITPGTAPSSSDDPTAPLLTVA